MYRTLCFATWILLKLAGVERLFGPAGLTPPGPPFGRYPSSANSSSWTISIDESLHRKNWLGWKDSNLRMAGSKPAALPLGDTPTWNQQPRTRAADSQPVANLSSKGESFSPRAKKAFRRRRQLAQNFAAVIHRLDGQKNTGPSTRQARGTIPRQPIERTRHLRISAPNHAQAVVPSTGRQEAVNCDGRRIPCQFRILKYLRRADTDIRLQNQIVSLWRGQRADTRASGAPRPLPPRPRGRGRIRAHPPPTSVRAPPDLSRGRCRFHKWLSATKQVAASELPPPKPPPTGILLQHADVGAQGCSRWRLAAPGPRARKDPPPRRHRRYPSSAESAHRRAPRS